MRKQDATWESIPNVSGSDPIQNHIASLLDTHPLWIQDMSEKDPDMIHTQVYKLRGHYTAQLSYKSLFVPDSQDLVFKASLKDEGSKED